LLWLAGCGGSAPDARPNIVLIVVDTLRADHLGTYGYSRPTSPAIDALAARGTWFEHATAPSSWTRPSVASLFTSRLPSEHGAVSIVSPLDPGVPSFVEALRDAGYRTVGISGNFPHLSETSGLARGFQTFESLAMAVGPDPGDAPAPSQRDTLMRLPLLAGGGDLSLRAPTAEEVNERAFEVLPKTGEQPFLLYVHYMDPHSGYLAPPRFRALFEDASAPRWSLATSDRLVELASGRAEAGPGERQHLIDLYDAEIRYVDTAVEALLEEISTRGYGGDTIVVLLADHGEEFEEHGGWFHGITLHQELLRVPLIFHDPRQAGFGARPESVDLLDVPVTLLALAGLDPLPGMRGHALFGKPATERTHIAELHPDPIREAHAGPIHHAAAITRWPWKALVARTGQLTLYNLAKDPDEQSPLDPTTTPGVPADLITEARQQAQRVAESQPTAAPIPDADREGLRALGYIE
jgi:arylsulfatase A-like enzyme